MPRIIKALLLAALSAALLVGTSAPAQAATPSPHPQRQLSLRMGTAPSTPYVTWHPSNVYVSWNRKALDTQRYCVEVVKRGFYGPWRYWCTTTSGEHMQISYSKFPYQSSGTGGYAIYVWSVDAFGNQSNAVKGVIRPSQAVAPVVNKERTAYKDMVPSLVKKCAAQGMGVATVTGLTLGTAAAFASWVPIPGVAEVTWGAVFQSMVAGGVGTAAYCVIFDH